MRRNFSLVVLVTLLSNAVLATDTSQLEAPAIPIEQALVVAQRYVSSEHVDVSDKYIAGAEWNPRSGLISFWRVTWLSRKHTRGGSVEVKVYADGRMEHVLGK